MRQLAHTDHDSIGHAHSRSPICRGFAVTVKVDGRTITVKGPRGSLTRNFKAVSVELLHDPKTRTIKVQKWFGARKQVATVRTVLTHIKNLITGVTKVCSRLRR